VARNQVLSRPSRPKLERAEKILLAIGIFQEEFRFRRKGLLLSMKLTWDGLLRREKVTLAAKAGESSSLKLE
jgi:hypothetical protein